MDRVGNGGGGTGEVLARKGQGSGEKVEEGRVTCSLELRFLTSCSAGSHKKREDSNENIFLNFIFTFNMCGSVKVLVAQSCPTVCNLMDCSMPGSAVHEILQAGEFPALEWVAISVSRGSS